jgi:hypothetical protein
VAVDAARMKMSATDRVGLAFGVRHRVSVPEAPGAADPVVDVLVPDITARGSRQTFRQGFRTRHDRDRAHRVTFVSSARR